MAMNFGPQWMRKTGPEHSAPPPSTITANPPATAINNINMNIQSNTCINSSSPAAWKPNTSARHAHHSQHHSHRQHSYRGNVPLITGPQANSSIANGAVSGFTSWGHTTSSEPSLFKYSRDFMVELYASDLPVPDGCDLTDKVLVSDQVLEPMTNLPFTDIEKKILATQSIHSELKRSGGTRLNRLDGGLNQPSARGFGGLFDQFGGIAGIGESLLAAGGRADATISSEPYSTMADRSSIRDTIPNIPPQPQVLPQLSIPPKWVYKDLQNVIQGPFSHMEMHEWYMAGYLQPDLMVRHRNDAKFEPLAKLIKQYGPERPFLMDAEEYPRQLPLPPITSIDRRTGTGGLGLVGAIQGREDQFHQQAQQSAQGLFSSLTQQYSQDPPVPVSHSQEGTTNHDAWADPAGSGLGSGTGWVGPVDRGQNYPGQARLGYQQLSRQQHYQQHSYDKLPQQPTALFSQFGASNNSQSLSSPPSPQHNSPISSTPLPSKAFSPAARIEEDLRSQLGDNIESIHGEDELSPPEHFSTGWDDAVSITSSIRSSHKPQRQVSVGIATNERQNSRDDIRRQSLPTSNNNTNLVSQVPIPSTEHNVALPQQSYSLPHQPKLVQTPWGPPASAIGQKLPLKEIQEIEQRERDEREKERHKRQELLSIAAVANNDAGSWAPATTPWQAPAAKQKSLMEIMQEEEDRKQKEGAARAAVLAAANIDTSSSGGTRYADLARNHSGIGSAGWASAASAPQARLAPAGFSPTAVAVRPGAPRPAPMNNVASLSTAPTASSVGGAWNVVGKSGHVVSQFVVPSGPRPPVKPPSASSAPNTTDINGAKSSAPIAVLATPSVARPIPHAAGSKGSSSGSAPSTSGTPKPSTSPSLEHRGPTTSASFLNWCRQSLKPLEKSTTAAVKVDEFIQILSSVPIGDSSTLHMICDDTLGGLTAIDPRKFADEFTKRRIADRDDPGSAVGTLSRPSSASNMSEFDTGNRFVTVQKKKAPIKNKK